MDKTFFKGESSAGSSFDVSDELKEGSSMLGNYLDASKELKGRRSSAG